MASPNVDKMLLAIQNKFTLALELSLALNRIQEEAGVKLSISEKQEFFNELVSQKVNESTLTMIWD